MCVPNEVLSVELVKEESLPFVVALLTRESVPLERLAMLVQLQMTQQTKVLRLVVCK